MTTAQNPERQADYQETPYVDSSWEMIDEIDENPHFEPLEIAIIESDETRSDAMFADYGGQIDQQKKIFAHSVTGYVEEEKSVELQLRDEIDSLKAVMEQKVAEAHAAGVEEGKQYGREEAMQEEVIAQNKRNESIEIVLKDLIQQSERTLQELESDAVKFSLEIAKKLVGQAVEINPEYIIEIVREALSKVGSALIERVRVSPQDFEFIEIFGVRKMLDDSDQSWNFESDETVRSGCVVDTSAGEIDYQLEEAWQRIAEQVMRVVK
ncbi:hypothetical protein EBR25_04670 [bacterium]|nr:hypothetical protein [bacterium]